MTMSTAESCLHSCAINAVGRCKTHAPY